MSDTVIEFTEPVAGRFVVHEKLGEGGMGAVYRATQTNLDRDVALKVLLPAYAANEEMLLRFEREAKVASALKHKNAVEIYDVGLDQGTAFLAMEFLRGVTLREICGDGHVPPLPDALLTAAQLADVLLAAHVGSIVHRDLKPENVFLEDAQNGEVRVVVVDFGLAFIDGDGELGRMTREGLVVGTPGYLSPEQAQGGFIGPASDIYSLGVMLYEMVTGTLPFTGSELNVLTQHIYVAPTPPSQRVQGGLPRELDQLILSMMSKRADDRPTAADVLSHLTVVERTMAGRRQRGRDARYLQARMARMVSIPARTAPAPKLVLHLPSFGSNDPIVAVVGEVDDDLWLGLPSNGYRPVSEGETDFEKASVYLVLDEDVVVSHAERGKIVVAAVDPENVERVGAYLRAGVSEVVKRPLSIDDVVRKIKRALRKARQKENHRP